MSRNAAAWAVRDILKYVYVFLDCYSLHQGDEAPPVTECGVQNAN